MVLYDCLIDLIDIGEISWIYIYLLLASFDMTFCDTPNPRGHFFFHSVHEQYSGTVSMNGSSNSVQHNTLLATGQVFRARGRIVGSVAGTTLPLVRALMPVLKPVVCASSTLSRAQAWSVGHDRNSLSQHHPWKPCRDIKSYVTIEMANLGKTLSWHKGDPCRDPST